MNSKKFVEWLETCPTHKWEVTAYEEDFVVVSFPIRRAERPKNLMKITILPEY